MTSWLVCSTPLQALQVRALAGDIVLCSYTRPFTFTVSPSTRVYKWVPANLMLGVTLDGLASHPGGSRNTPSRFMLLKLGYEPSGSYERKNNCYLFERLFKNTEEWCFLFWNIFFVLEILMFLHYAN